MYAIRSYYAASVKRTTKGLPVGAYTYSQGLEWAVEAGTVKTEAA